MKTHTHLTDEELFALAEFRYELLESERDEFRNCSECMRRLADTHVLVSGMRESLSKGVPLPDEQRLSNMISNSFAELSSVSAFLGKTVKILSAVAAVLILVVVGGYAVNTLTTDHSSRQSLDTVTSVAEPVPEKLRLFHSGVLLHDGRTNFTTLRACRLKKIDRNRYQLAEGSVQVAVKKGGDVEIQVKDKFLVRVLGTVFTVDVHEHAVDVTVSEGLVEVVDLHGGGVEQVSAGHACHMEYHSEHHLNPAVSAAVAKVLPRVRAAHSVKIPSRQQKVSSLDAGRAALQEGRVKEALLDFEKELKSGSDRDKALFEIIRIYEHKKGYVKVLDYLHRYSSIAESQTTYREEFFIKGCNAQIGAQDTSLSYCKRYLSLFPNGYKRTEIERLVRKKER